MIIFWIKEAIRIFTRAKSSFILSLITLSISLFLIIVSVYSVLLSNEIEEKIKNQFTINIFLIDTLTSNNIRSLKNELLSKPFVSSAEFISKEKAAEIFVKETGEDFRKILDYNPLPASFYLKLKSNYVDADSIKKISKELEGLAGVDDIIFEHVILNKVILKLKSYQKYIFALTVILLLISIYITYSTIKLIIALKNDELETMKLVGAKLSTIKMPIILNEMLTGLLAGILTFAIIKIMLFTLNGNEILTFIGISSADKYIFILFIGPILSALVSVIVLRKISLKV